MGADSTEGVIDAAHDIGHAIGRIQNLIGIHLPRDIGVGGDLSAAQVNRLEPGFDGLHGMISGQTT